MRGEAGFEFAKFIGCADKNHFHGIDAPAHMVRRLYLDQRAANHHADHVRSADQEKRSQREQQAM